MMRKSEELTWRTWRGGGALRMETSGSVFSGVVRLTAVIRRDRPDSTLLAENHRECDRQKKNQWMGTKGKFI